VAKESGRTNFLLVFQIFPRAKIFGNWLKLKVCEDADTHAVYVHDFLGLFYETGLGKKKE